MMIIYISVGAGFIYWAVGWAFAYGDSETNPASRFIGVKGRVVRTSEFLQRSQSTSSTSLVVLLV